jgi:hypothetical protein
MTSSDPPVIGTVVREVLAELLPDVISGPARRNGAALGRAAPAVPAAAPPAIPRVPAPPVARVHRPSQRPADAVPRAVPQAAAPARAPAATTPLPAPSQAPDPPAVAAPPALSDDGVHEVAIDSQADLDAFVRDLVRRLESPRDRLAIRAGKLRFALRRPTVGSDGRPPAMRVERGAVTERLVAEAAASGSRLVLGPKAVLTPMGRDRARTLGVEIEKERQC